MARLTALASTLLVAGASARSIPSNVQNLYNSIKAQGQCSNIAATGFFSNDHDAGDYSYCLDHKSDDGIVYLQGTGGQFVNMDVDCDGTQNGAGDDGRCKSSDDTQDITAFQDTVASYNAGINDLNAYVHPYVVFGNSGGKSKGWPSYNPQSDGIQPLSVMAVVCGNQLIYGIWGDTNGADGDEPMVGEASLALATACYGDSMNGNNGHSQDDVLYIAFTGSDAVPGASNADWSAGSYADFEASIESLGDSLIAKIGGNGSSSGGGGGGGGGGSTGSCSWAGHCKGASCSTDDDCSDSLVCKNGKCASS